MSNKVPDRTPKPFLKWIGGKGRLLPQLSQHYPKNYNDFYEPFIGGGALFFSLNPQTAHINDTNSKLIATYETVKEDVEGLIKNLKELERKYRLFDDFKKQEEFYYEIREQFNSTLLTNTEKAPLLIFLNKTCFNGLYRENSKGGFNSPFGNHTNPTICDEANLRLVSKVLQRTTITNLSFEESVMTAGKDDFVYFDPPYHPLNSTSSFTRYAAGDFTTKDQEKLRDLFKNLSDKGCFVMLSNSDTPFIKDLYKDFNIHTVMAGRSINSVGTKRGKITEVLVTNF